MQSIKQNGQMEKIKAAMQTVEHTVAGTEKFYPVGTAGNIQLQQTKTVNPAWALAQPPDALHEDDIRALMRTDAYKNNKNIQDLVTNWHLKNYGPDQPVYDAAGRMASLPPIPDTVPPVPGKKPIPPNSSSNNDKSGGAVQVQGYTRGARGSGQPVQVDPYTRSLPTGHH
jgi:hypothetical protein